jgi:long-chain acyl-CoA synthetase
VLAPLLRAAHVAPHARATTCDGVTHTYAELLARCRRLMAALVSLGLEPGDRVAVVAGNCHRYLELLLAVPGAGMIVVPLAPSWTPQQLQHALAESGAKLAFVDDGAGAIGRAPRVVELGAEYEALIATHAAAAAPGDDLIEGDLAAIYYTGGTTGPSKGVMLTHRNLLANALHMQTCVAFGPSTRWLIAAPMFHISGSLAALATIGNGGSHVVLRGVEPERWLDVARDAAATATLLLPSGLAAVTDVQAVDPRTLPALRVICHGGAPMMTATLRQAATAFPAVEFVHLYGATETAPIATALPRAQTLLDTPRARSCGRAVTGVRVTILARDGSELPDGEIGEVAVRGPNVMRGYWARPALTAQVLDGDGYRTGDLGYLDGAGFLYLVDRAEDAIVVRGRTIASTDVEDVLCRHPAVREAAAFGASVGAERAVHAVVSVRRPVAADELRAFCRVHGPADAVPQAIDVTDAPLPKSAAGKIRKQVIRASAAQMRNRTSQSSGK